jgi:hypothetical protein
MSDKYKTDKSPKRRIAIFAAIVFLIALASCSLAIGTGLNPLDRRFSTLEFGHQGPGGVDYCDWVEAPSGGTLFSIWTKVPDTLKPPAMSGQKIRGNMIVYSLRGSNWELMGLVGNIDAYLSDHPLGEGGVYNANLMINIGGDVCVFYDPVHRPLSVLNDWIWVAWQVVVNDDRTITFRQWLKYGIDGEVFPAANQTGFSGTPLVKAGEDRVYFSQQPGDALQFRIGYNNYYDNVVNHVPNSYLCHARMEAMSSEPTLQYLEKISRLSKPDTSAYADYKLSWERGAPNLQDRSGHNRHLSVLPGGALYEGPESPGF